MPKHRPSNLPVQALKTDQQPVKITTIKSLCILLAVIAFIVFANTLQNGYTLDDATVITSNSIVKKGFGGISELLTTPRLKGFSGSNDEESYRPIPMVTHAVEYGIFEAAPAVSHLVNVLLFIGCVVALFLFLSRLLDAERTGIAFIAALLFAVHPIHTEVVANIKSRDELLCFLFAFLSLNALISYAETGKTYRLISGAFLLLLSYLSKETVIAFVAVIPLVFFFFVKENRKRSIYITISAIAITAVFLVLRNAILTHHEGNSVVFISNPLVAAPDFATRIATAIMGLGIYMRLSFVPFPLICDYSYNTIPFTGFGNIYVWLSAAAYLAITVIGIYRLIKKPKDAWAFSILFFLFTLALFSNIFFLVYSQLAERFLFFASVGPCLAIALACSLLARQSALKNAMLIINKQVLTAVIPICLIFSAITIMRNADWKDNYTLFTKDVVKAPDNAKLYFYTGSAIAASGELPTQNDTESLENLRKAVTIYPDYEAAHAQIGAIYDRKQMFDSGLVYDKRAVDLNSDNQIATYNLARAYYATKNYPEAITYFKRTVSFTPDFTMAWLNLARCCLDNKQYEEAITYFEKTLALEPALTLAQQGLAYARQMKAIQDTSGKKNTPIQ